LDQGKQVTTTTATTTTTTASNCQRDLKQPQLDDVFRYIEPKQTDGPKDDQHNHRKEKNLCVVEKGQS
jgi:hypothetical protein